MLDSYNIDKKKSLWVCYLFKFLIRISPVLI